MPPAKLRTPFRGHSFNCPIFDDYFGGAGKAQEGPSMHIVAIRTVQL
jgi:hypothetical protein